MTAQSATVKSRTPKSGLKHKKSVISIGGSSDEDDQCDAMQTAIQQSLKLASTAIEKVKKDEYRKNVKIYNILRWLEEENVKIPPEVATGRKRWVPRPLPVERKDGERARLVTNNDDNLLATPKTQTRRDFLNLNIDPKSVPHDVKSVCDTANAVLSSVAQLKLKGSAEEKRIATALLNSSPIRKTRGCRRRLALKGFNRMTTHRHRQKRKRVRDCLKKRSSARFGDSEFRQLARAFFERDENSRALPDKKHNKCDREGNVVSYRVSTDYVWKLHAKFHAEYPNAKFKSLTKFRGARPPHVYLCRKLKTRSCLCQYCENFKFLCQRIDPLTAEDTPKSPSDFIKKYDDCDEVNRLLRTLKTDTADKVITYTQWYKQPCKVWKTTTKKVNGVETQVKQQIIVDRVQPGTKRGTLAQFKTVFREDCAKWRMHHMRFTHQYHQMRLSRENLNDESLEVQVDFAENLTCQAGEEVQSAHWNPPQVTIQPTCMRYRAEDGTWKTKTFIYTSELSKAHNAEMVFAILRKFILVDLPRVMGTAFKDKIRQINIWSDSPFSQYRNCFIFALSSLAMLMFGIRIVWNYLEAGHGKGACDGAGGAVKSKACMAAKQGVPMWNYEKFWEFCENCDSVMEFCQISVDEYTRAANDILHLRNVGFDLGIARNLHAVARGPLNRPLSLRWRELSCNCVRCLGGNYDECDWHVLGLINTRDQRVMLLRNFACGCKVFCFCAEKRDLAKALRARPN